MKYRCVICADEELTPRWNNYLGVTRHMIPAHGEPIIHRTQRQLLERGFTDIVVVCAPYRAKAYLFDTRVRSVEPPRRTGNLRENSAVWTYQSWVTTGCKTVFLFADTYYTDEFMNHLIANLERSILIYGRIGPTTKYQSNTPELFAVLIDEPELRIYLSCLESIFLNFSKWVQEGRTPPAALAHLIYSDLYKERKAQGIPSPNSYRVNWSDLTDDFDYPRDWDLKHKYFPEIFTKPNES